MPDELHEPVEAALAAAGVADGHLAVEIVGEILESIEGIEFVRFGGEDVVRHKLVQRIVEAYGEHAERLAPELRPADRRRAQ